MVLCCPYNPRPAEKFQSNRLEWDEWRDGGMSGLARQTGAANRLAPTFLPNKVTGPVHGLP